MLSWKRLTEEVMRKLPSDVWAGDRNVGLSGYTEVTLEGLRSGEIWKQRVGHESVSTESGAAHTRITPGPFAPL